MGVRGGKQEDRVQIRSGPWDREQIEAYLRETVIPVRIASAGQSGPLVQSLWFRFDEDALWCCTQRDALIARRLGAEPRCGFEVSGDTPPYRGVRGQGTAELAAQPAATLLPQLIDRYQGAEESPLRRWLLARLDTEVAIRIGELTVASFDYSGRMGA